MLLLTPEWWCPKLNTQRRHWTNSMLVHVNEKANHVYSHISPTNSLSIALIISKFWDVKIIDLCLTQTRLGCEQLTGTVSNACLSLVSSRATHSVSNSPERSPAQPGEAGLRAAFSTVLARTGFLQHTRALTVQHSGWFDVLASSMEQLLQSKDNIAAGRSCPMAPIFREGLYAPPSIKIPDTENDPRPY